MDFIIFGLLVAGGLFAGSIFNIAISRLTAWNKLEATEYKQDFAHTIKTVDVLLPILLVMSLILTLIFALNAEDTSRTIALVSVVLYVITLTASVAILVPLQNNIIKTPLSNDEIAKNKRTWQTGHIGRTALSLMAYSLAVLAVVLS